MHRYCRSHLSDPSLLRSAETHAGRERLSTADLLADLAEIDARRLYLPAAYPSMFAWCVAQLHLCEQAAYKRILAARTARRFPALFEALAQGRLHLSAVCLLAPHLREDTVDELLVTATHKTKSEIERLLAARFPRPDVLAWVEPIPQSPPTASAEPPVSEPVEHQLSPGIVQAPVPARVPPDPVDERARVKPLAPERYALQLTMSQSTHDKLRYAQALLGHQIPSGDIASVLERALDALIPQLEKRRFAAAARPRHPHRRSTASSRHVPAQVKRTVWERDGGQCTFVSEAGRRCPARTRLEFDHIDAVARGGEATVAGIRLRCRAHNQYGAECTFGAEFMRHKRIAAAEARAAASGYSATPARSAAARAQAAAAEPAHGPAIGDAEDRDVVPWLRQLGFSVAEARRAAARCEDIPDASLEQRLRAALSCFGKRSSRVGPAWHGLGTAALAGAAPAADGP